jgi:hypothetical protein
MGASVDVGAVVDGGGALAALHASASGIAGSHRHNRRMNPSVALKARREKTT